MWNKEKKQLERPYGYYEKCWWGEAFEKYIFMFNEQEGEIGDRHYRKEIHNPIKEKKYIRKIPVTIFWYESIAKPIEPKIGGSIIQADELKKKVENSSGNTQ